MNNNFNYWLVGATWSGIDKKDDFYKKGAWQMGWDNNDKPQYAKLIDSIKPNDRIAIKSLNGKGSTTITIHAIGIVKLIEDGKVYVDWILTDVNKVVDSKGKFGTIHKLNPEHSDWIHEIFSL